VSPFYIPAALGIVLGRALNGAGDSIAPMIITILSLWGLQVPLAIWLSHVWQPATQGIWWAISAAMTVNGLLTAAWFETGRWRKKRV
jgi:Na+-driven multidrug efflux pump